MTVFPYPKLNLPEASLRLRREENSGRVQVFDPLRGKWIVLTPEEWVRQNFVNMLVYVKGYYKGRMANEVCLTLNETARRCDTVIFNEYRQPLMIVEYKAPDIPITQRVFDQIARYNMVLHARFLAVSNGLNHYCCEIDYSTGSYRFLKDIPPFTGG